MKLSARLRSAVGLFMAASLLAACTSAPTGAPPAAPGSAGAPAAPAASAEPVHITFWYGLTGANGDVTQKVVDRFNASQTQVIVDAVQQPNYDDTINKLNASLAGGDLPNVVQVYDIGTQRMIDSGRVRPAQDFIER
ncbi:MAG: sn-glycerol 3-phosphate transport system substrate-binding protein, partial [Chloroflexota bacterium]|nr:sn-glycerol 3-phosphate transport system substrate-binding protein [Chloroflexota bacterium]